MKYNLDELHWQEFEVLVFKILQILISPSVQFIEGGNDKGRDIIYDGRAKDYQKEYSGKWIFQVKHKSKMVEEKELSSSLLSDLRNELIKVFVKNKFECDNYIFVTNKTINGPLFDQLNNSFKEFKETRNIKCNKFNIISYRHIESCIDNNNTLKWSYPNIINHPDFLLLIKESFNHNLDTRRKAWLNGLEKQRQKFVYTQFFQKANDKLNEFPAIILSGPPKSGKTFNAEMLALNFSTFKGYQPILIDHPDEIENSYERSGNQIFICDDAFGKYSLAYRSQDWFNKLERILNLADDSHLFIFTSREYIFRAFINYGNEVAKEVLEKIIVESHNYSIQEKLAILKRYTTLSNISDIDKSIILDHETELINHKNFSPETIRAFFANVDIAKNNHQLRELEQHLEKPDSYLSSVFFKLSKIKQAALLSVLCTIKNNRKIIFKAFESICNDLNISVITDSQIEFDELDDSILRIFRTDKIEEIFFYHPSMQEFLTRQLIVSETGKLREIVLKNINNELLSLSIIKPSINSLFNYEKQEIIKLNKADLAKVEVGLKRLVGNEDISLYQVASIFYWFRSDYHVLDLKINDSPLFMSTKDILVALIYLIGSEEFYYHHKMETTSQWSRLFAIIKNTSKSYGMELDNYSFKYFTDILKDKIKEASHWMIVFRILGFTSDDYIITEVGRDWLNNFFKTLKNDINELGYEIFGTDFPEFKIHNKYILENKHHKEKLKEKPNRTWYPRFLNVKDRIDILKEIKGSNIGNSILERLILPYDEIQKYSDFAKNRHGFNINRGWWKV